MRRIALLLLIVLFLNSISSECSSGQIDINSASATDLDKLYGIGPAKATAIINTRPFEKVDDLISVSGIGEKTLAAIKAEGLACVKGEGIEEKETEKKETVYSKNEPEEKETVVERESITEPVVISQEKTAPIQTISLSPQDIKSEKSNEGMSSSGKYAGYGLVIFCILLSGLWIIKKVKIKEEKNEFGE